MPTSLETKEQSHSSGNLHLTTSQARSLPTEPHTLSHLEKLLHEYTKLHKSLVDEIDSEQYKIREDSRKRLKIQVHESHEDEVRRLKTRHSGSCHTNGNVTNFNSRTKRLAENPPNRKEYTKISENFQRERAHRRSSSSSQQSAKTASIPQLKDEIDASALQQPKSILRKPRDRFLEYPTAVREGVRPLHHQPSEKPHQQKEEQVEFPYISTNVPQPFRPKLSVDIPAEFSTQTETPNLETTSSPFSTKPTRLRPDCDFCHFVEIVSTTF